MGDDGCKCTFTKVCSKCAELLLIPGLSIVDIGSDGLNAIELAGVDTSWLGLLSGSDNSTVGCGKETSRPTSDPIWAAVSVMLIFAPGWLFALYFWLGIDKDDPPETKKELRWLSLGSFFLFPVLLVYTQVSHIFGWHSNFTSVYCSAFEGFEAFGEAAPQLMLNGFVILHRGKASTFQKISMFLSLVTVLRRVLTFDFIPEMRKKHEEALEVNSDAKPENLITHFIDVEMFNCFCQRGTCNQDGLDDGREDPNERELSSEVVNNRRRDANNQGEEHDLDSQLHREEDDPPRKYLMTDLKCCFTGSNECKIDEDACQFNWNLLRSIVRLLYNGFAYFFSLYIRLMSFLLIAVFQRWLAIGTLIIHASATGFMARYYDADVSGCLLLSVINILIQSNGGVDDIRTTSYVIMRNASIICFVNYGLFLLATLISIHINCESGDIGFFSIPFVDHLLESDDGTCYVCFGDLGRSTPLGLGLFHLAFAAVHFFLLWVGEKMEFLPKTQFQIENDQDELRRQSEKSIEQRN